MVLTNKHVVIAMIVAPVLAVLAWFAADLFTGETPRPAAPGQSYPLLEKSNCRYESGACDLANENFKLVLNYREVASELLLRSSHPLDGVVLGIAALQAGTEPLVMRASDGQGLEWRLALDARPGRDERIRLVAMSGGSSYFADTATVFLQSEED